MRAALDHHLLTHCYDETLLNRDTIHQTALPMDSLSMHQCQRCDARVSIGACLGRLKRWLYDVAPSSCQLAERSVHYTDSHQRKRREADQ